jgi:hypothetical protein
VAHELQGRWHEVFVTYLKVSFSYHWIDKGKDVPLNAIKVYGELEV